MQTGVNIRNVQEYVGAIRDLVENHMEKIELMPNEILIIKSNNESDGMVFGDAIRSLGFGNHIFHVTPNIEISKLPEDVVLKMADEIHKKRGKDGREEKKD